MRSAALPLALMALGCATPHVDPASPTADQPPQATTRLEYEGTILLEGHFANPGDTMELPLRWVQTCNAEGTCLSEETAGERGEPQRVWSTPEATWAEGAEHRLPEEKAAHHRRLLTLLAGEDAEVRFTHPRLGMTTDRVTYAEGEARVEFHDASVVWSGTLRSSEAQTVEALDVPPPPPAQPNATPSMVKAGEGIWDVRLPLLDARCFVIEFETFVVTIEAPWSSAAGEQAVDLIAEQFPNKPIRYALYSHHHPHASGGLRALMAAGATVVAPRGHADYVKAVLERDFSQEPDRLHSAQEPPSVIDFEDAFTIAENGKSVQVIDIGTQSQHTTHYMMFWLPQSKALLQGDLGWFTTPEGEVRVGRRSAGLLEAIDERGLPVETLWQGWPVNTQDPSLPMSTFRAALSN